MLQTNYAVASTHPLFLQLAGRERWVTQTVEGRPQLWYHTVWLWDRWQHSSLHLEAQTNWCVAGGHLRSLRMLSYTRTTVGQILSSAMLSLLHCVPSLDPLQGGPLIRNIDCGGRFAIMLGSLWWSLGS